MAVLRIPPPITEAGLTRALATLISACALRDVTGRLWVVDAGRVREYADESRED